MPTALEPASKLTVSIKFTNFVKCWLGSRIGGELKFNFIRCEVNFRTRQNTSITGKVKNGCRKSGSNHPPRLGNRMPFQKFWGVFSCLVLSIVSSQRTSIDSAQQRIFLSRLEDKVTLVHWLWPCKPFGRRCWLTSSLDTLELLAACCVWKSWEDLLDELDTQQNWWTLQQLCSELWTNWNFRIEARQPIIELGLGPDDQKCIQVDAKSKQLIHKTPDQLKGYIAEFKILFTIFEASQWVSRLQPAIRFFSTWKSVDRSQQIAGGWMSSNRWES